MNIRVANSFRNSLAVALALVAFQLASSTALANACYGGVYAENTPSAGHEGFPVYCSSGDKPNQSQTPSPYCWVRTWDDCVTIQNGGVTPTPAPTQAPISYPTPYQTPIAYGTPYSTPVDTTQTQQQQTTQTVTVTNNNNNNNSSSSSSSASAVAQTGAITINVPQSTREIIREVTVRTAAAPAPRGPQPQVVKVSGTQYKELPKTGLPFAAVALASLLPLGLKLKRFGSSNSETITPSYLREERLAKIK